MPARKILLPIYERPDFDAIADAAFSLARRFDALVEGVYAYTAPADQVHLYYEDAGLAYDSVFLKEAERISEDRLNAAKQTFAKLAKSHGGVETSFVSSDGGVTNGVAARGRIADVAVVGMAAEADPYPWEEVRDAALFHTGGPALVMPDQPISESFGQTIVVGWKNGREAARALQAAKPFMQMAEKIVIVSAGEDAVTRDELKDVEAYVSLSHANVTSKRVGGGQPDAAVLLLNEAGKEENVLLVMGAYSHWRWTESVFGGVTDHVLKNTQVPVLMAH